MGILSISVLFVLPSLYKSDKKDARVLFWIIVIFCEPMFLVSLGTKVIESSEVYMQKYSLLYSILDKINFGLMILLGIEFIMLYKASDRKEQARKRKVFNVFFIF